MKKIKIKKSPNSSNEFTFKNKETLLDKIKEFLPYAIGGISLLFPLSLNLNINPSNSNNSKGNKPPADIITHEETQGIININTLRAEETNDTPIIYVKREILEKAFQWNNKKEYKDWGEVKKTGDSSYIFRVGGVKGEIWISKSRYFLIRGEIQKWVREISLDIEVELPHGPSTNEYMYVSNEYTEGKVEIRRIGIIPVHKIEPTFDRGIMIVVEIEKESGEKKIIGGFIAFQDKEVYKIERGCLGPSLVPLDTFKYHVSKQMLKVLPE